MGYGIAFDHSENKTKTRHVGLVLKRDMRVIAGQGKLITPHLSDSLDRARCCFVWDSRWLAYNHSATDGELQPVRHHLGGLVGVYCNL